MRTLISIAAVAGVVLALSPPSFGRASPTISLGPVTAVFDPANRLTRYTISRYHLNGKAEAVTVSWKLTLELVDKAGAPNTGVPGSGAAVDLGCTNAGVGIPEPVKTVVEPGHPTTSFVWHHPDLVDSVPPKIYHCDHNDMGPSGHQGLITVTVADKRWSCTASYKGTNSSDAKSVEDKIATEPKCTPVA